MENKPNLAKALVKVQSEMKQAPKNGKNPHFGSRFSTYEDLIEVSRPILSSNDLAVNHYWESDGQVNYFITELKHSESGERDISRAAIFLKDPTDMHKTGAAESYFKRRMYEGICGIDTSDIDDDGNSVSSPPSIPKFQGNYNKPSESSGFPVPQGAKSDVISSKQWGFLKAKIKESGIPQKEQSLCLKFGVRSLSELPWRHMNDALNFLAGSEIPKPMLDPQYKESSFIDESVTPF